jgi:hypothetical protein
VVGFAPVPRIRNEIVGLMLRHAKVQWAASLLSMRSPLLLRTDPCRSA